ncbi:MAG: molybdopterin-dependent oxidoreductase [Dehalococcoidia bacterium]|nr:molybdopterin-dependent oxidoreductase [Dehalococcoidia bacterium]
MTVVDDVWADCYHPAMTATSPSFSTVGSSVPRYELADKLTGAAEYSADISLPEMLHGVIVRSPHPHADVLAVDVSAALALPGVRAAVTPDDVPDARLAPDMPILDNRVRFAGDEVAAVAADDLDTARYAADLVQVEYQPLPFVIDPVAALEPDAPQIHSQGNLAIPEPLALQRGDVDAGFADADIILEETYYVPTHSATPLEPRAALAHWDGDQLTVWKSTRGVHVDRAALAQVLGLDTANVRVIGPNMGGGYGNKDESRMAALAALMSRQAGRPVRIEYSREEEFVAGRTRHGGRIILRVGIKNNGDITAIHGDAVVDSGAYQATAPRVARRMGQGMLYLYRCPNVRFDARPAATNKPVSGSYRALGAPQGHFALETLMDRAAEAIGMDPLAFRLRNHVPPEGQAGPRLTPPDEIVDGQPVEGGIPFSSNGLEECLRRGAAEFGWNEPFERSDPTDPFIKRGRGASIMIYRGGVGDASAARLSIDKDGKIHLVSGLIDVGEGAVTVLCQMAAEALSVPYEEVIPRFADTEDTPDAPITAGSTATFSTGTAVLQAAERLREGMLETAAGKLEAEVTTLSIANGAVFVTDDPTRRITYGGLAQAVGSDTLSADATIIPGSPDYIVNSFGAHFCEVEVDTATGRVRVKRYVAAHDSGRIINPRTALNQVEGAISQMLGFALSEELITDGPTGITLNGSYLEHKSPTIQDYPDITAIFADVVDPVGPMGAKGLGEVPSVGVAPAIANALYDAIGVRFTRLPITPDRVLDALAQRG